MSKQNDKSNKMHREADKFTTHGDSKALVTKKVKRLPSKTALSPFIRQIRDLNVARLNAQLPAGWFSVGKDCKNDAKDVEAYYQKQLLAVRMMARAAIGNDRIRTKLYYEINTAATIATAYATSVGIAVDNSAEFNALAGLYDEYKVTGGKVRFQQLNAQGTPSVTTAWMAMGYDSTYNTTPTSIVEVLESTQSRLYGIGPQIANNFWAPYTAEAKGFFEFPFRIPGQSVADAVAVTGGTGIIANFPGEWIAANSQAGTSVGYLRTYVQSSGSGNTITLRAIVEMDVEWRERT